MTILGFGSENTANSITRRGEKPILLYVIFEWPPKNLHPFLRHSEDNKITVVKSFVHKILDSRNKIVPVFITEIVFSWFIKIFSNIKIWVKHFSLKLLMSFYENSEVHWESCSPWNTFRFKTVILTFHVSFRTKFNLLLWLLRYSMTSQINKYSNFSKQL